jgi:hypothetical protein
MANQIDTLLNIPGPGEAEPIAMPAPEPRAAPASQIDPTVPVYGQPTTASVRANFATAQTEITGLMQQTQGAPFLSLAGGHMTGPMYLFNDPTDGRMPATKDYVDAGGSGGGGGMPEAPTDGKFYLRSQGAWVPGLALSGGSTFCQMTGELLLAGNPADPLGATPKQYVDAIGAVANGAVPLAGTETTGPMTGLLDLSGDPTDPLGAVTKQYADAGLALKANAANTTLTGIVTVSNAGRVIIEGPTSPSLTLYNTTTGSPVFGVYSSGNYLSFGLATPSNGNPNGSPFATMDQSGNFAFTAKVNATSGRLISSGTTTPSITVNNTTQSNIFGLWVASSDLLNFGTTDANGAPQSSVTTMDASGNWNMNANLTLHGTTIYFGPGGAGLSADASNTTSFLPTGNGSFIWYTSGGVSQLMTLTSGGQLTATGMTAQDCTLSHWGISYSGLGSSNHIGFNWGTVTAGLVSVLVDGGAVSYGLANSASDERLKSDIVPTQFDGLAAILATDLWQFRWKDHSVVGFPTDDPEAPVEPIGFVAQRLPEQLARAAPGSVKAREDGAVGAILSLDQNMLLATCFDAIKRIESRLATLEGTRH